MASHSSSIRHNVWNMLQDAKPVLAPILMLSAVFNILLLSGSFFMLLVYDNVLSSRSEATLAGLLLMVAVAYIFQGWIDVIRTRILLHTGAHTDQRLSHRLYDALSRYEQEIGPLASGSAPVRDMDIVCGYVSGPGPLALMDLPYFFLFLIILTILHWSLGLATLVGLVVMLSFMWFGDQNTRNTSLHTASIAASRFSMAEDIRLHGETVRVLGMREWRRKTWDSISQNLIASHHALAEKSERIQVISKAFRLFLQSFVLALGAFLIIKGQATGGVIIASSILSARALMPIEQTIGQWKSMTEAAQAWARLSSLLNRLPEQSPPMPLPRPQRTLDVQGATGGPPGSQKVTITNISFSLRAGEALAVIGHSGSGKSTLMRTITGAWPLLRGSVRFDSASLEQWDSTALGKDMGYVPQAIDMFTGSIAENIARFDPNADPQAIIAAAQAADVHNLIISLPGGYEYQLGGPSGGGLSAGQKQRIALARALYGDPFLIVLDEPNSNLDAVGEEALMAAIEQAKKRGAIVLIVGHRPSIFHHVDHIMVMANGQVVQIGDRTEMLKRLNSASMPQPVTQAV